jgi:cytochrome b6
MILELLIHISRVYLTGGFRRPRELTWLTGVLASCLSVTFGVTGYSLPWDQVGFWACKIVTGVPDAVPLLGGLLVSVSRGGSSVGQMTLTRFYSAHTFLLPVLTSLTLLLHFTLIRKSGISGPS